MRPEKAPEISCFESLWTSPSTVWVFPCCRCWYAHRHTSRVACHMCRDLDYCSKQGRGTSQHAIIATYHRSVKQGKNFIDLESIIFSGSTRLLWIRVSPGSSSGIACQNDIHADPKWHSCRNGTDFNTLISQSNFCIFHNTTQSVIIFSRNLYQVLNSDVLF